ncbi:MAG TPA: bifunctional [glutamine synthetase] adenylyltransferase/[glutamine synthetase]-adenylyl-L-tyrosine phosphorylase [Jiangellaceae bacterium]
MVDRAARASSRQAWLARAGFADPAAAARELGRPELAELGDDEEFLQSVSNAPDPDLALASVARLLSAAPDARELAGALRHEDELRTLLLAVVGFSAPLADHLVRHPDQWSDLRHSDLLERAAPTDVRAALGRANTADELRVEYRRRLLQLAALDLTDVLDMAPVSAELAGLAAATLDAALELAARDLPPDAEPCRLAVIGMGKTGGAELNYVSDVDVIFVAEPVAGGNEPAALKTATALATAMMRLCSEYTAEGTIWPVDAALRPEGKSGPLVRTVASHTTYYQSWAKTWEFQALLKARHVAGDAELAQEYISAVQPLVWRAADRDGFVEDVRAMRRLVTDHVRPAEAERQLKLGPGGLRDVEFAVQLLQLVHGRTDESLRSPNTLEALEALIAGGYVGRADGAVLDQAYRFLRTLEHRIQLQRLRRTHVVPSQPEQLRRLARALGLRHAEELTTTWRRHAMEVHRLHEKLFYRPLLTAVARLPGEEARLTPEAARQRLEALGYLDPAGALRHLEALTRGVSRRAAIQRTLLPVLLGWFADGPEPDAGLAGFRKVSDALGDTHWYLRLLRDERAAAERMARVLASGRYATELLLRAPEAVRIFGDDTELEPRPRESLEAEALAGVRRHDDAVAAISGVRAMRRRELFRIATANLVGRLPAKDVGEALTAVAEATLAGALETAVRAVELERREPLLTRVAVIAMGRLGGREMSYASDADVLFVHQPLDGADDQAAAQSALAVANEMRRLLAVPSPEPALTIDPNLRPEGRQGPLVRTLASYRAYYARWGEVWERQALLRAAPCCGDPMAAERFMALIDPLRWPRDGLTDAEVREIRRIKARVESERLPRGVDRSVHLKLGPGGLSDVEWAAQLIQLRHGCAVPDLRTTQTRRALDAAVDAELLNRGDRDVLVEAWNFANAIRDALVLVSGRPSDMLPTDVRTLAAVSRVLGYGSGEIAAFLDDHRRRARRARTVVERIFFHGH